ncbi:hypothetical protein QYE76_070634 [Lolium multiflorum]|uniref:Uncharacterized protein n=1 Tax=Lolium multiflorum TaxID=4521 RepID=A0AAD8SJA9_LOLMU|nr:hypothetical protein QYE76_070634 [Lolium multiflorum]
MRGGWSSARAIPTSSSGENFDGLLWIAELVVELPVLVSLVNCVEIASARAKVTGLVEILKKYDKRPGALICLPFIQNVLLEPFFTTDILYQIVKECEAMLDQLLPLNKPFVSNEDGKEYISTETSL